MKNIAVLGSTGSIGVNALEVISMFPGRFKVKTLSTNGNVRLLSKQVKQFRPEAVCIADSEKADEFKEAIGHQRVKIYIGEDGLNRIFEDINIDIALISIVGSCALLPILKAIDSGVKRIALANKEALVMAGRMIIEKAKKNSMEILPIDSEHSAIFQCIGSECKDKVSKIYLTGSGGPLLNTPVSEFKYVTAKDAVKHPKWQMGRKISVDSATMMNKGLEVIEAHWLFNTGIDKIEVLIHPEAVVHSMVRFIDGAILAQMGICDMKGPIQYALTYPERFNVNGNAVDFLKLGKLSFLKPDFKKFPCLSLAYDAAKKGKGYPCVLNTSNEVAVREFLKGKIKFTDIYRLVEKVYSLHKGVDDDDLKGILELDKWARVRTQELAEKIKY